MTPHKTRPLQAVSVSLVLMLSLCATARASAQSAAADKALAEALFDEGRKLMGDNDYAHACPKFERSQELDSGIGTLLYLADCYEKNGQFASAWASFREAASRAHARGEAERERIAVRRAGVLEPLLAKLNIVVETDADLPGLSVTRNARPVQRELWGIAGPVDAGTELVDVTAPGRRPWHGSIQLSDGQTQVLKIPVLAPAPQSSPAGSAPIPRPANSPSVGSTPSPADTTPSRSSATGGHGQRTLGYLLGAVGIVGLGVGSAFGLAARNSNNDANTHCSRAGGLCDAAGVAAGKDVDRRATVSNISFGIGAAASLSAVILLLTLPDERSSSRSRGWGVAATAGTGGAQVSLLGALP
jgi:hypothetical protein